MKRYLLFVHGDRYKAGGWNDLAGDYDALEDALLTGRKLIDAGYPNNIQVHVVDLSCGNIVAQEITRG